MILELAQQALTVTWGQLGSVVGILAGVSGAVFTAVKFGDRLWKNGNGGGKLTDRVSRLEERTASMCQKLDRLDERLATSMGRLDERLDTLMLEIARGQKNGQG